MKIKEKEILIKVDFYMLMLITAIKSQEKKIFTNEDLRRAESHYLFNILTKSDDPKYIRRKARGAKINVNTVSSYNKEEIMTIPDPIYDLIISTDLLQIENKLYLIFKKEEESFLYLQWKRVGSINKKLYIGKKSFNSFYLNKMIKEGFLTELRRGSGNKIFDDGFGTVDPASKVYYAEQENDIIKRIICDEIFISFDELYNEDFTLNTNKLWKHIKKTQLINYAIKVYGEQDVKSFFNSFKL